MPNSLRNDGLQIILSILNTVTVIFMITNVVILFQEEYIIIIIPVSMLSEKVDIRNARYYEIVNKKMNKALYVSSGATDY